jgi:hypothetical protein
MKLIVWLNSPEPPPIRLSVPHLRLIVWVVRLNFFRQATQNALARTLQQKEQPND